MAIAGTLAHLLDSSIEKHGNGLIMSIFKGISRAHAVHSEHTGHGFFLKVHFPQNEVNASKKDVVILRHDLLSMRSVTPACSPIEEPRCNKQLVEQATVSQAPHASSNTDDNVDLSAGECVAMSAADLRFNRLRAMQDQISHLKSIRDHRSALNPLSGFDDEFNAASKDSAMESVGSWETLKDMKFKEDIVYDRCCGRFEGGSKDPRHKRIGFFRAVQKLQGFYSSIQF